MCGIITIIRKDDRCIKKQLLKSYEKQKSRGTEGFGFCSFNKNKLSQINRFETEKETKTAIELLTDTAIMFHHRTPTSTPNYSDLAHPIRVENKALKDIYYVIHNGVITNSSDLRKKHESEGFSYTTICKKIYETLTTQYISEQFNDSESLAIEISKAIESESQGVESVSGSIAFMCLRVSSKGIIKGLYYGRNEGNPLNLDIQNEFIKISSEGKGNVITPEKLFMIDLKTLEIYEKDFKIGDYKTKTYSYKTYKDYKDYSNGCGYGTQGNDDYSDYDDSWVYDYNKRNKTETPKQPDYTSMKKNKAGFVWLTGDETQQELENLYTMYDYKLDFADEKGNMELFNEIILRLDEINTALDIIQLEQEKAQTDEELAIDEYTLKTLGYVDSRYLLG